jgi:hypothetical protein
MEIKPRTIVQDHGFDFAGLPHHNTFQESGMPYFQFRASQGFQEFISLNQQLFIECREVETDMTLPPVGAQEPRCQGNFYSPVSG